MTLPLSDLSRNLLLVFSVMKYVFYLSTQVFWRSLNLNNFIFHRNCTKECNQYSVNVTFYRKAMFCFTICLWIIIWAVIIGWTHWCFCLGFFLVAMKGCLIYLTQCYMSYNFHLFTGHLLMGFSFLFCFFYFFELSEWLFVLCGLRGTNQLYYSWSLFWFCRVKMAVKII